MTIARQNTAASLPITIHHSESVDIASLWKLVRLSANEFWWRTKSYTTILGVMLLTLVSLIFLSMHWSYRRLFPLIGHQVIGSDRGISN
ncbi:MAG: hypothetical protein RM022_017465 [Nostoc sp. EfeVER01]|uniref:hypothetical protein n=1 Tax=unclassified Nostoc TaxID=2593658 RepID=UPI002AD24F6D|nr:MULTISPECIES: hypothetical protein [unclassified Nostoc]MDZ7947569.1 hypothetical protein [Nostoc sp. EfeVER01]MDZ7994215.1 hypothetical protein [Nostoc sp. EspVER01]